MAENHGSTNQASTPADEETPLTAVAGYLIPRLWHILNVLESIRDLNGEEGDGTPKDFRIDTLCTLGEVVANECVQLMTNADEDDAIAILRELKTTPEERISAALKEAALKAVANG